MVSFRGTRTLWIGLLTVLVLFFVLNVPLSVASESTSLSLTTSESNYEKGEMIQITGSISGSYENLVENEMMNLMISSGEWERKIKTPLVDNQFSCTYRISFGDPEGSWKIQARTENWESTSLESENITITTPSDIVYYTTQFFSPPSSAEYQRGDNVNITINVTEAGSSVKNADNVTVYSPTNENIYLSESSAGMYTGSYVIPYSAPLGKWCLSGEVRKTSGGSLKVGGSYISVELEPATPQLDIISPNELRVNVGDSMHIQVRATYPNGSLLENEHLTGTIEEETLEMTYYENGIYKGTYIPSSSDVGGKIMELKAEDYYGNQTTQNYSVYVESPAEENNIIFFGTIAVTVAIGALGSYYIWRSEFRMTLEDVVDEKEHINNLRAKTAERYFKEGEISRESYDTIMSDLSDRLNEIERKEEKLRGEEESES